MKAETTYHAILGQIIREMRKNKGFDQKYMAKEMGMKNRSSWSKIESGATNMSMGQFMKIEEILKCDGSEILRKATIIEKNLIKKGYTVHYQTAKEVTAKSKGKKGLAIIASTALALLVANVLLANDTHNKDDDKDDDKKN